ncbi:alpha-amylase family glycosyl hydrolase [Aeoliella mucimassa]|uniref:1,4-alpha-glucan branching enzyme n=1 Tax=Aeoliella mucimassa TaxID=2527972 RepID=A0A518AWJ0_9BACT|nr:alpha-amylase family glycosyl hydrolase [Aeoliella mucimassa]QDU59061.1 1,4-alpha-glucan branching enzyme GlgB [Aeoliella mucimassa]
MPITLEKPAAKIVGMGCLPHDQGVAFRVWAPNAERVALVGDFNHWDESATMMEAEDNGHWYANVAEAEIGDEYRYLIFNGDMKLSRIDPRCREVTNSVGNSVVHDPHFDWEGDKFKMYPFNELVIYEMHVGTFCCDTKDKPGTFESASRKFEYLRSLGINCIQLMPAAEFAGDYSWGYNPAHIYAVESAYGGPHGLKQMVKLAHQHGLAVILDVVYNHFGPSDLHLWQFDGWSENNKGGIYFYNDWRSSTPWGDSRPDYGRQEVRSFIHDNAVMWLEDFHMDGLRYDMTLYMRSVNGNDDTSIPEGWSLAQWINSDLHARFPGKLIIAEDMRNNNWLTKPKEWGGAGFNAQWDAEFVHPIRDVVEQVEDQYRSMFKVHNALCHKFNYSAFERVIYSESHDEVANGKSRVPSEIDEKNPHSWYAQKRTVLASAMVLTAPGIPMLFQGQEFLRTGWFDDTRPIDWHQEKEWRGIVRLYRDLIHLRLNKTGITAGLTGQRVEVHHLNDNDKVVAFRRWKEGGPGDDVIVVANFATNEHTDYRIGLPRGGTWKLRFNSDSTHYSDDFDNTKVVDLVAEEHPYDGQPYSATLQLASYGILVFSEDKPTDK